jgi:GPI mannosyltransferase 3
MDDNFNWTMLVVLRIVQALFLTKNMVHPDEYWQATQVAYNWVYGGVDLPWEWDDAFKLRNAIYPAYLAAPLYLLKCTGLDQWGWLVRLQPYLTHCPLVILNDLFIWRVGKRVVGVNGARIGMLLMIFSRAQNEYIIRCFTNGIEQIFSVIAFYFYIDQGNKFTMNTVVLTALISIAFMMRSTSPVGWIPLLAHKVLFQGSFIPFLVSGIITALPILAFCVWVDSKYYGGDQPTFTSYNFLQVNVVHGLSKYFGEDPFYWYLAAFAPCIYTVIYPVVLYANTYSHVKMQWAKKEVPYMSYYSCFYVFFFSLIPHKELRFLLPILPFTLLTSGQLIAAKLPTKQVMFKTLLTMYIVVEVAVLAFLTLAHHRSWEIEDYLISKHEPVHSFYRLNRFDTPYYSWFHGQNTTIYSAPRNPKFAKLEFGSSLPMAFEGEMTLCTDMIGKIQTDYFLPEYITIA